MEVGRELRNQVAKIASSSLIHISKDASRGGRRITVNVSEEDELATVKSDILVHVYKLMLDIATIFDKLLLINFEISDTRLYNIY